MIVQGSNLFGLCCVFLAVRFGPGGNREEVALYSKNMFNFQMWKSQDVASNETNQSKLSFLSSFCISAAQFVRENKADGLEELDGSQRTRLQRDQRNDAKTSRSGGMESSALVVTLMKEIRLI